MDWDILIDEAAIAALLPSDAAPFARPIKEGLVVFLGSLPTRFQQAILADQATLPASTSMAVRLGRLARRCPVLHKLGQVLARDQRLAEELRCELRPLESLPPSTTLATVQPLLTQELGPLDRCGIAWLGPPIAEASVAVVVPFRDTRSSVPHEGVFKLLKPGIVERLELELEILGRLGSHLDERCAELQIPPLDYQDVFEQVREKLRWETRLDQEQRHLIEAAEFYKDESDVQIPSLFDHCTPRLTAMERVFGVKITDHQFDCPTDKRRLAYSVGRVLVARPALSPKNHAIFHGDPHAGNILYTRDGRLAILDWSLVFRLSEVERIAIAQITLGAITLDAPRIVAVLTELDSQRQVNPLELPLVVARWLRRIQRGQMPGLTWLTGMLDEATQSARLRLGPEMMTFRKSLHSLEGVVRELGSPGVDIEKALLLEVCVQFAREWPTRWLASPTSREFATRLSNVDIGSTILSLPIAAVRFWQTCCFPTDSLT